jgi:hypothetical protein
VRGKAIRKTALIDKGWGINIPAAYYYYPLDIICHDGSSERIIYYL